MSTEIRGRVIDWAKNSFPGLLAAVKAGNEAVVAIGNTGTGKTIDLTNGVVQTATLTGNCTFTMPSVAAGRGFELLLYTGAGSFTATFTGVKWGTAGAPTITTTAGKMDRLRFLSDGTDWFGVVVSQGYTPTVGGTHLAENFNLSNSTSSPGPNWTARNSTLGIISNGAYAVNAGFVQCSASHVTPMTANDMSVSWTVGALTGSGLDFITLILGGNTAGEAVWAEYQGDGTARIYSVTDWVGGGASFRVYGVCGAHTPGDVHTITRVGTVYSLYKNGSPVTGGSGGVWNDSGGVVPIDSSHRFVGLAAVNNAGNYRIIDAFAADSN